MKGVLQAVVFNGFQVAAVVGATLCGSVGAARLVYFLAGIAIIATLGAATPGVRKKAASKRLPRWRIAASRITDITTIPLLVFYGFWFSAVAMTAGALAAESVFSEQYQGTDPRHV